MTKEFLEQLIATIYKKVDNKIIVVSDATDGSSSPYPEGTLCLVLGSGGSGTGAYRIAVSREHVDDIVTFEVPIGSDEGGSEYVYYHFDEGDEVRFQVNSNNGTLEAIRYLENDEVFAGPGDLEEFYEGDSWYAFTMPAADLRFETYR